MLASSSKGDACAEGVKGKRSAVRPLFQINWWRVVLDESQAIKNANTLVAHAAHHLRVTPVVFAVIDDEHARFLGQCSASCSCHSAHRMAKLGVHCLRAMLLLLSLLLPTATHSSLAAPALTCDLVWHCSFCLSYTNCTPSFFAFIVTSSPRHLTARIVVDGARVTPPRAAQSDTFDYDLF